MAVGRDLKGRKNKVVAIIGDGAMTAGQAYEAMNNAGYLDSDMIVILNDNKQVSLPTASLDGPIPPVGALSSALSRLQSNRPLRELREVAKVSNNSLIRATSVPVQRHTGPCTKIEMENFSHIQDTSWASTLLFKILYHLHKL